MNAPATTGGGGQAQQITLFSEAVLSSLDTLWRWHHANELDRWAPPYLVERAEHEVERAARKPFSELLADVAEGELHETAGAMVRFADRRQYEDELAVRFDAIGRHGDAAKLHGCRRRATFMLRSRDAKLIPFFDEKCRRARFCPDEAHEEAMRTTERDLPRVLDWLKPKGRRRRAFFVTISPPLVPRGRLAWAQRMPFDVLDKWRRRKAGRSIKLARAAIESPLSKRGLWHPHLHAVIGVAGAFNFDVVRAALNKLLRQVFPVVAGDVLRRPSGEVVRVERMRYAADAVREVMRGKSRRFECDPSRDVACLSDGSELSVAEVLSALACGGLTWGYKLRYRGSGKELRIAAVRHALAADRGADVVEVADGAGEIPLDRLAHLVARGKLDWSGEPMSFQLDFQELRDPRKVADAYRELVKYMMKHTEPAAAGEAPGLPEDAEASFGVWREPPGLLELPDAALKEWCEAGDGFRRSRAYGELHGVDAPHRTSPSPRPSGRSAKRAPVDLILVDRSAANKADKSAADGRALRLQGCYDGGFYDSTGPP